ncbi:MAG: hypothetical protein H6702_13750 [Myxococcales bacterium]|nr:hypothetical protein [Myxococcales bacterium]
MERVCGGCRFFRVTEDREDGRIGSCRLEKVIGVFRESMRGCASYAKPGDMPTIGAGTRSGTVRRARTGSGEVPAVPAVSAEALATSLATLPPAALKTLLSDLIAQTVRLGNTDDLGRRWATGTLIFWAADRNLKPKEMALDQFLHKLVMIRDNLRVLEQKINSHGQLQDAERIDLQRRVTLSQSALFDLAYGWCPGAASEHPDAQGLLADLLLEVEMDELEEPLLALGERWHGGQVRYVGDGVEVEEPMERFYFRLMRLRGRMMALEATLAAHPHLGESDGDVMSGYIRRSYGSLTSFNILLKERADYFTSGR